MRGLLARDLDARVCLELARGFLRYLIGRAGVCFVVGAKSGTLALHLGGDSPARGL
jgi:hypothetical protein